VIDLPAETRLYLAAVTELLGLEEDRRAALASARATGQEEVTAALADLRRAEESLDALTDRTVRLDAEVNALLVRAQVQRPNPVPTGTMDSQDRVAAALDSVTADLRSVRQSSDWLDRHHPAPSRSGGSTRVPASVPVEPSRAVAAQVAAADRGVRRVALVAIPVGLVVALVILFLLVR